MHDASGAQDTANTFRTFDSLSTYLVLCLSTYDVYSLISMLILSRRSFLLLFPTDIRPPSGLFCHSPPSMYQRNDKKLAKRQKKLPEPGIEPGAHRSVRRMCAHESCSSHGIQVVFR